MTEQDLAQKMVRVGIEASIATVTLDNPSRRNAVGLVLREQLFDAIARAMADEEVRVVVLTGAEGVFSAGGDLSAMDGETAVSARARLMRFHRLIRLLVTGEKPVIAAVEGYAVGVGLSLAAACDIVVTASDAKWACSFNKVGLMPDGGAGYVLPLRMGTGRARMVMMLAETFEGTRAAELGLAETVCAPGDALSKALEIAGKLKTASPLALGMTKAMFARLPHSLDDALRSEAELQGILFTTEDFEEGKKAFFEKRSPEFRNR